MPSRPGYRGLLLALFLILIQAGSPSQASPDSGAGAQDGSTTGPGSASAENEETEPDNAQLPERALTQSELAREIEILQRDLEELVLRIGEATPTDEQQRQVHDIAAQLAERRAQLAAVKDSDAAEARGEGFRARWIRLRQALQDITRYDVRNGMFRIQVGVRFQIDTTTGTESDSLQARAGAIDESVEFRRGRVYAFGRLLRRYDFRIEYDFAADAGPKDAYLEGIKFTRFFKWRVGHFREPFSLSRQTSSFDLGMMETPLPVQAMTPGRNLGIMLRHSEANDRMFWAVSVTTEGKVSDDNRLNGDITFTGRVTGLPLYRGEGDSLLHIGASYSLSNPVDDTARVAARPEARFAPLFVDTGRVAAESLTLTGVEMAMVRKGFWAQSEWIGTEIEAPDGSRSKLDGAYLELGWFLTGERRFYLSQDGVFGRITPNRLFHGGNPFSRKGNGGALEFTGRVSTLDLNSGAINGGEMRDVSVGMNWYLNQTSRVMLNVIRSDVRDVGTADLLLLRLQFNP